MNTRYFYFYSVRRKCIFQGVARCTPCATWRDVVEGGWRETMARPKILLSCVSNMYKGWTDAFRAIMYFNVSLVSQFWRLPPAPRGFNATWSVELRKNFMMHAHPHARCLGVSAWGEPGGLAIYKPSRNGNKINGWGAECYPLTFFVYFSTNIVLSGSLQGNRYLGVP
jgi:hypothetical protein